MTIVLAFTLGLVACSPTAPPEPPLTPVPTPGPDSNAELRGGVLATFDVQGKTFRAFVTNANAIEQLLALQRKDSFATIPNGALRSGPGAGKHNDPWSWHLDSKDIEMAAFTIELCDGTPDMVQAELDYWLNTVKRYCPWDARLVALEDFRK